MVLGGSVRSSPTVAQVCRTSIVCILRTQLYLFDCARLDFYGRCSCLMHERLSIRRTGVSNRSELGGNSQAVAVSGAQTNQELPLGLLEHGIG
jgi:hypothetical protein